MYTHVVERIEWKESNDWLDYKEHRRILHSFLELSKARDFVVDDSRYYTYEFKWNGNRSFYGYEETMSGNHGCRYEIRLIPHS